MRENNRRFWFNLSALQRQEILSETAIKKGVSIAAVEKDWWVVHTLAVIFSMECAPALVFKGGTSLSKGWNAIQRFSEDIDLALDREYLGFSGDLTKGDIRRLRRKSYRFITEVFTEELKKRFAELGFTGLELKHREVANHDQDPLIIEIYYPTLTESDSYLKPGVLIEVGCRSLKEPFTPRSFSTILSEVYPERPFSDQPITVPVVNPERTFLEKIFLLHEEFQKPTEKIRVGRLSRHLYDIEKLMRSEYADLALADMDLYRTIVGHRAKFTAIAGIDYEKHHPASIKFVPPQDLLPLWERDYMEMVQTMIYGDPLVFGELINRLHGLQDRINRLEWG